MDKQTVIIVGAGAAGLMAALELADKYMIIVLEANKRVGGRIHTMKSTESPLLVEAGAEFIHGYLPVTTQLLERAGIEYTQINGKFYRKEKGQWKVQTEMIEGWDMLIKEMKCLKEDMPMEEFLRLYFPGEAQADFRRHVTEYTEGFDIADVQKASVKALYKEWSHEEEEIYRIPGGYSALIEYLQKECERKRCQIVLDQSVSEINWERNHVTVQTSSGQQYFAQKCIVTVPISVLRKTIGASSIRFTPAIPEYIKAAGNIGMGNVIKVVLYFREPFWGYDLGFVFSDEVFPTWWTQLPDTRAVLTGWAGGPKANHLSNHSEDEALQEALQSLSNIFDKSISQLKNNLQESFVYNWEKEKHAQGAYTYSMPESPLARKILNTPIEDTLFFAGEALAEGDSPGTVEAALISGKEVAKKIAAAKSSSLQFH